MLEAILWLGHLLVERVVKFHAKDGAIVIVLIILPLNYFQEQRNQESKKIIKINEKWEKKHTNTKGTSSSNHDEGSQLNLLEKQMMS